MSKSTFSDSHQYVQRYEDISNASNNNQAAYAKKKVSKASVVIGLVIILAATLTVGFFISKGSASASNSHYDYEMEVNPTYKIGYDDGYGLKGYNEIYSADQAYNKGYADGTADAK